MIENNQQLKDFIIQCLDDKKAENLTIIDLGDKAALAEYIIVASGRSIKNIQAMAEHLTLQLKHQTKLKIGVEGLGMSEWVLIDLGNIIINIFHPEARERFNLEKMWQSKSLAIYKPHELPVN